MAPPPRCPPRLAFPPRCAAPPRGRRPPARQPLLPPTAATMCSPHFRPSCCPTLPGLPPPPLPTRPGPPVSSHPTLFHWVLAQPGGCGPRAIRRGRRKRGFSQPRSSRSSNRAASTSTVRLVERRSRSFCRRRRRGRDAPPPHRWPTLPLGWYEAAAERRCQGAARRRGHRGGVRRPEHRRAWPRRRCLRLSPLLTLPPSPTVGVAPLLMARPPHYRSQDGVGPPPRRRGVVMQAPERHGRPRMTAINVPDSWRQDVSAHSTQEDNPLDRKRQATGAHHQKMELETDQFELNSVADAGRHLQPRRWALRGGRRFLRARPSVSGTREPHTPQEASAHSTDRPTRRSEHSAQQVTDMEGEMSQGN